MKTLVTGGNGFVGSWLCKSLLDHGHEVRAFGRGEAANSISHPGYSFVSGDILDRDGLVRACQGVQVVFHLAGLISYKKSDRAAMTRVNVNGTANMISAAQQARCRRFVHFSSVTSVGAGFNDHQVMNEDSTFNLAKFDLGYYETKRQAEKLVIKASLDGLIDGVVINPSNIYGRGDAQKGSRSTQLKIARGEFPFYTSGGVSVAHIDDVVKATIRAAEVGRTGERYILSGENLTIENMFKQIADLAGRAPPKIYLPNFAVFALSKLSAMLERVGKSGPVASESAIASTLYHWYDHSKATRELDFQPRSAHSALADSVEYMRSNGLLKQ